MTEHLNEGMNPPISTHETSAVTDCPRHSPVRLAPPFLQQVGLWSLAGMALTACGGGGNAGPATSPTPSGPGTPTLPNTPTTPTTPDTPSPPSPPAPTRIEASRFLQQAAFGGNDADLSRVQQLGLSGWIDAQQALPVAVTGWDWLMQQGYNSSDYRFSDQPMNAMMWHETMAQPDVLRKRVAVALSELFVVSARQSIGEMTSFNMAHYWDLLNQYALGSFRDLLEKISTCPAMGYYLNSLGSRKDDPKTGRKPDENYARELLQLFTIGLVELNPDGTARLRNGQPIETYRNEDVMGLARVFTGYDLDDRVFDTPERPEVTRVPMALFPNRHSMLAKSFLGLTIPANTEGSASLKLALDHIFRHANIAPFVSRHLIQRLITSNPTPAYVGRMSAVFNDDGHGVRGNLGALIKAILLDPEARLVPDQQPAHYGKLREPMLRLTQWARTFGATSADGRFAAGGTYSSRWSIGQGFLQAPSVFGFFRPSYTPPNSLLAQNQQVAPELQLCDENTVSKYINFMRQLVPVGLRKHDDWPTVVIKPDYAQELALAGKPAELLARLNLLLCANQLSARTLSLMTTALTRMKSTGTDWQANRVHAAIFMVMVCPDYMVQR